MALSWQFAVLKILAASENGELPVAGLTRDLSILVSSPDGWERKLRQSLQGRRLPDVFTGGLVDRPRPGVWRITTAGRDFLHLAEPTTVFGLAAE